VKHADASGEQLRTALHTCYGLYQQNAASSAVRVVVDIDSFSGL
jgi:hypothetical protein